MQVAPPVNAKMHWAMYRVGSKVPADTLPTGSREPQGLVDCDAVQSPGASGGLEELPCLLLFQEMEERICENH